MDVVEVERCNPPGSLYHSQVLYTMSVGVHAKTRTVWVYDRLCWHLRFELISHELGLNREKIRTAGRVLLSRKEVDATVTVTSKTV